VGMNALATLAGGGVFVQSVCVCVPYVFFFTLSFVRVWCGFGSARFVCVWGL